jgi:hypothetical protein
MSRGQRDGSLQPYSRISRPEPLLFLSSSSSIVLTRLSGPQNNPDSTHKYTFLYFSVIVKHAVLSGEQHFGQAVTTGSVYHTKPLLLEGACPSLK